MVSTVAMSSVWPHNERLADDGRLLCGGVRIHLFVTWSQTAELSISRHTWSNRSLRCGQSIGQIQLLVESLLNYALGFGWKPIPCGVIHWAWLGTINCLSHASRAQTFVEVASVDVFSGIINNVTTPIFYDIWVATGAITIVSQTCWLLPKFKKDITKLSLR
jgi:hypothetical protein